LMHGPAGDGLAGDGPASLLRGTPRLVVVATLLLVAGCDGREGDDPPPPRVEVPAAATAQMDVLLTFHRGEEPVPVRRTVTLPRGEPATHPTPEAVVEAALGALVHGPTPGEREGGITSFFSAETAGILESVSVEEGRAVVNFRDFRPLIPNASTSAGSLAFLTELNGAVFQNTAEDEVEEVEYRLEGSCDDFWAFLQRGCDVVPRPETA
jgi:hypothetical protein